MTAQTTDGRTVSIYALVDPRTSAVRYVGQTASPLALRLAAHVTRARTALTRSAKDAWIVELLAVGHRPAIRTLRVIAARAADEAERLAIQEYRDAGCPLPNVSYGGARNADEPSMQMWSEWAAWMARELVTPAELALLTGTAQSGWRNRAAAGLIPGAFKKGKQWLLPITGLASVGVNVPLAPDSPAAQSQIGP